MKWKIFFRKLVEGVIAVLRLLHSLFLAITRELLRNNSKDSGGDIAKFSPAALAKFFFEKISKKNFKNIVDNFQNFRLRCYNTYFFTKNFLRKRV